MAQEETSTKLGTPSTTNFTWVINNFTKSNAKKLLSDVFIALGYNWRLYLDPKGNNGNVLWVYLEVVGSAELASDWSINAEISLTLANQFLKEDSIKKYGKCKFCAGQIDWGCPYFMPLRELSKGYIVNDSVIIEIDVSVGSSLRDSKRGIDAKRIPVPLLQTPANAPSVISLASSSMSSRSHSSPLLAMEKSKNLLAELSTLTKESTSSSGILGSSLLPSLEDTEQHRKESLTELQGLKNLKVAFHHAMKDEVVIHDLRLPKQSTVGDVINELKTKVELSHSNAELRILQVFYHRIYKIFPPNEKIENINDLYWTLRAEEIPEEEKNLGPHDRLIHVYHFNKESAQIQMLVQNFGEPFFLVIHEGETLGEVKVRIQKKLQVPDEEFAKWKFAFMSPGRPEYLQDSDIVFARFQRRDVYGAWEQYLGLEHSYTAPKQSYAANQMQGTPDTRAVSLTATSMSGKSSSTLLENLKNLLAGFSITKGTEKSTSSSNMSEGSLPPNPPSLQQHREVLKNYLASSLESIEQANAFDEIQRITLLLLQHSTSSFERTILKDLASRLEAFKVIVPTIKSSTENLRAQLTSLSGKKADVGARLGQARKHCDSLEAKFRKNSEEETEIEKQIMHLMKQKEGLRISKDSLALELEKFNEQVTKDVEEWKVISEESEEANNKWLQVRETLAQANLSWKLFKQNLEQCEKGFKR